MRRKSMAVLGIAACLAWVALIFLFSSQNGSDSHSVSGSVSRLVAGILYPGFSSASDLRQAEILNSLEPLIRKLSHYAEYTVLGILSFLAMRGLMISRRVHRRTEKPYSKMSCGLFAFYPCVLVAACDELLQSTVAGRTSAVTDVLLDSAGIITGLILCAIRTRDVTVRSENVRSRHRKGGSV